MSDVDWSKLTKKQRRIIAAGREKQARMESIVEILRNPYQSQPTIGPQLPKVGRGSHKRWLKRENRRVARIARRAKRKLEKAKRRGSKPKEIPQAPRFSKRYLDYIQSSEWKAKRRKIFKERGRLCEICGKAPLILQLHHKTYARLCHELPEDLVITCRPCHEKLHGRRFAERNNVSQGSGDLASTWMQHNKIQAIQ